MGESLSELMHVRRFDSRILCPRPDFSCDLPDFRSAAEGGWRAALLRVRYDVFDHRPRVVRGFSRVAMITLRVSHERTF